MRGPKEGSWMYHVNPNQISCFRDLLSNLSLTKCTLKASDDLREVRGPTLKPEQVPGGRVARPQMSTRTSSDLYAFSDHRL